jgi:histidinol-phosphate/aromatic aminotransferase/cobyric acid decarboxylase-like protein
VTAPAPLRLHYNENTAGCSPAALAALRALTAADVGRYPDVADVNARVARWFGVSADRVQVTNGLDEGIQAVSMHGCWHRGAPKSGPASALIVEPAFEVYEAAALAVGEPSCAFRRAQTSRSRSMACCGRSRRTRASCT